MTGTKAEAGDTVIQSRIPVSASRESVTRNRENVILARPTPRIGSSRVAHTGAQQECITIGGTGTKSHIRIARAIRLGWMDQSHRWEVHHGLQVIQHGLERYHDPNEHLSRVFAKLVERLLLQPDQHWSIPRCF